jgi:hypothetical protein
MLGLVRELMRAVGYVLRTPARRWERGTVTSPARRRGLMERAFQRQLAQYELVENARFRPKLVETLPDAACIGSLRHELE